MKNILSFGSSLYVFAFGFVGSILFYMSKFYPRHPTQTAQQYGAGWFEKPRFDGPRSALGPSYGSIGPRRQVLRGERSLWERFDW